MPKEVLRSAGYDVLHASISMVFQSLFYGIYIVLIPFSSHILLKGGLRSRMKVILLCAMLFPFFLSSAYWGVEVAKLMVKIQDYFIAQPRRDAQDLPYAALCNAIILLNYIFTDGIVVWRAWALCRQDYGKILMIPMAPLVLTILSICTTIGLRIYTTAIKSGNAHRDVVINICQISSVVCSLLTNLTATAIISHKTWCHRKIIRDGLRNASNKSTKAERILALLIESGIIYCISGATALIATVILLPSSTLGDIYIPVNVQIAGIYPTMVIVLVGMERTMNDTTFLNTAQAGAVMGRISPIQYRSAQSVRPSSDDLIMISGIS